MNVTFMTFSIKNHVVCEIFCCSSNKILSYFFCFLNQQRMGVNSARLTS